MTTRCSLRFQGTDEEVREAYFEGINPANMKRWFMGGEEIDTALRAKFAPLLEQFETDPSPLFDWAALPNPRGGVAAVVLVDQFPRNVYRGSARSFVFDSVACRLAKQVLARDDIGDLRMAERCFLLIPLEHSEDISDHDQLQDELARLDAKCADEAPPDSSVTKLVQATRKYADDHTVVVRRFGRYPHRNAVLGRQSTPEEEEYLKSAETWGQ